MQRNSNRRGFASMDPERQRRISRKEGMASHGNQSSDYSENDYEEEDYRGTYNYYNQEDDYDEDDYDNNISNYIAAKKN